MPSYQSVGEVSQVETQFQRCILGSAVNTALLHWDRHSWRQNFPTRVPYDRTGDKGLKPTVVWFPDAYSYKVSEPPA